MVESRVEFIEVTKNNFLMYGESISNVHHHAYSKKHLTSFFSEKKLIEYYQNIIEASDLSIISLDSESSVMEKKEQNVLGFIIAGYHVSNGVSKFLENNKLYVLWVMIKHPTFLMQKIRSIIISRIQRPQLSQADFRLLSIAVDSNSQSHGIGKGMLKFFEEVLHGKKIDCYGLSVKNTNVRAISFYERQGFVLEREHEGAKYYMKSITI